jgi:hypothetical protein
MKRLTPTVCVSILAALVALCGTGFATGAIPPLAKRAYQADNAGKLAGLTLKGIQAKAQMQETGIVPAIAPYLHFQQGDYALGSKAEQDFTMSCANGGTAVGMGFHISYGYAPHYQLDSHASADGRSWTIRIENASDYYGGGVLFLACLS